MENITSAEKNKTTSYIAFFDLDRTVTNSISGKSLAIGALRNGLFPLRKILGAIFLAVQYKLKLRDQIEIINTMVRWVKGLPEENISTLCKKVFFEAILPTMYNQAIAEIEFHKSENARVVILSSSLSQVCRLVVNHFGIDGFISTELEVKDGIMTGRTLGTLCFGEQKALRLADYCEKKNCSLSAAWYYGDSIADLQALNIVGHPICVNPDRKLRYKALKESWKIVNWKR